MQEQEVIKLLKIDLNFNMLEPKQSKGKASFSLVKGGFEFGLNTAPQSCKTAQFKANMNNGSLVVAKSSELVLDEMRLALFGKLLQRKKIMKSKLDFKFEVEVYDREGESDDQYQSLKGLVENYGRNFFPDGKLDVSISGILEKPSISLNGKKLF